MNYCTELCPKRRDITANCTLCKSLEDREGFYKGEFLKSPFIWVIYCLGYIGSANSILSSFIILIFTSIIVAYVSIHHFYVRPLDSFWEGVLIESFGMLLDIFILIFVVSILEYFGEKRRNIARYKEEIQDFLDWQSDEARYRLQGLIIRLNKLGVTNLYLEKAYLKGADLWNADLTGANLKGAWLEDANLHCANLTYADLSKSNLKGANLIQANLYSSKIDLSDIRGTDFYYAKHMNKDQFKDTTYDEKTKFPIGIDLKGQRLIFHEGWEPDGNRVIPDNTQLEIIIKKLDEIKEKLTEHEE